MPALLDLIPALGTISAVILMYKFFSSVPNNRLKFGDDKRQTQLWRINCLASATLLVCGFEAFLSIGWSQVVIPAPQRWELWRTFLPMGCLFGTALASSSLMIETYSLSKESAQKDGPLLKDEGKSIWTRIKANIVAVPLLALAAWFSSSCTSLAIVLLVVGALPPSFALIDFALGSLRELWYSGERLIWRLRSPSKKSPAQPETPSKPPGDEIEVTFADRTEKRVSRSGEGKTIVHMRDSDGRMQPVSGADESEIIVVVTTDGQLFEDGPGADYCLALGVDEKGAYFRWLGLKIPRFRNASAPADSQQRNYLDSNWGRALVSFELADARALLPGFMLQIRRKDNNNFVRWRFLCDKRP